MTSNGSRDDSMGMDGGSPLFGRLSWFSNRLLLNSSTESVKGGWSVWGNWTSCSMTCGTGTQTRYRVCSNHTPQPLNNSTKCAGDERQIRNCTETICPTNKPGIEYSTHALSLSYRLSLCRFFGRSSKLKTNKQQINQHFHKRLLLEAWHSTHNVNAGNDHTNTLNIKWHVAVSNFSLFFPVKVGWSVWGNWTSCNKTCGTGAQTRYRVCNNHTTPQLLTKKTTCQGKKQQTRQCNNKKCPTHKLGK